MSDSFHDSPFLNFLSFHLFEMKEISFISQNHLSVILMVHKLNYKVSPLFQFLKGFFFGNIIDIDNPESISKIRRHKSLIFIRSSNIPTNCTVQILMLLKRSPKFPRRQLDTNSRIGILTKSCSTKSILYICFS